MCQESSKCTDSQWFIVVLFVFGSAIALWFFYGDVRTDGLVGVVLYFYQMVCVCSAPCMRAPRAPLFDLIADFV